MKGKKISANEINKFCYCNYQWYYEKVYGTKEIRRINSEYCKENGFENKALKNFSRGQKFHNRYVFKYRIKKFFKLCLILFFIFLILYILNYFDVFGVIL